MKLQGRVYGYQDTIATFTIKDVTEGIIHEEGGLTLLAVRSDLGETPIIYSTIEPTLGSMPEPMLYALQGLAIAAGKEYAKRFRGRRNIEGIQSPEVEN